MYICIQTHAYANNNTQTKVTSNEILFDDQTNSFGAPLASSRAFQSAAKVFDPLAGNSSRQLRLQTSPSGPSAAGELTSRANVHAYRDVSAVEPNGRSPPARCVVRVVFMYYKQMTCRGRHEACACVCCMYAFCVYIYLCVFVNATRCVLRDLYVWHRLVTGMSLPSL